MLIRSLSMIAFLALLPGALAKRASQCSSNPLLCGPNDCYRGYYPSGCYACPASFYVNCDSGHKASETPGVCGFLGAGCKAYCYWNGAPKKDLGCGCDQGDACLVQDCVQSEWGPWSQCSETCNPSAPIKYGTQHRSRTILTHPAHGGEECGNDGMEQTCDSHNCRADCQVGPWSEWSACVGQYKTCGGGKQYRLRTITQQPASGGTACPALREERACNTDACYWFTLRGRSGNEQASVTPTGSQSTRYTLSSTKKIGVNERQMTVTFHNDHKNNDVYFAFATGPNNQRSYGTVDRPGWNCNSSSNRNKNCDKVQQGMFLWNGDYNVNFDMHVEGESLACEEKIKLNVDIKSGQFDTVAPRSTEATEYDCMQRCRGTAGCRYWVRQGTTGYCWLGQGINKSEFTRNDRTLGYICPVTCTWGQALNNKYLGSYAAGHSTQYTTFEAAKTKCEQLAGSCAGVTKAGSSNKFTVRGNPGPRTSPSGETSWEMTCTDMA